MARMPDRPCDGLRVEKSPRHWSRRAGAFAAAASVCVVLSACGSSSTLTASATGPAVASSGTSHSTTTSVGSSAGATETTVPASSSSTAASGRVPASFDSVSWATISYPDQSQCALPGSNAASPLSLDTTISGAPYYFHGNDGHDYAVVPVRCAATNSETDFVLLYQGNGTGNPQLIEVLLAGSMPASRFGVPVEEVTTSFSAVIAPQGTFASFQGGSLALCGGVSASSSGSGGPFDLNSFDFTEQGSSFTFASHAAAARPSSSGGACPTA